MSMQTFLQGRLRNTPLPLSHGLLPLFEAVINSIHSIDDLATGSEIGEVSVEIIRSAQGVLPLGGEEKAKRGAPVLDTIMGFKIIDNGVGFNDSNIESFQTLDTDYKASRGCRGVGRLLWLKAFDRVLISSDFLAGEEVKQRMFSFSASKGVSEVTEQRAPEGSTRTTSVHLDGYGKQYREKAPKNGATIANSLLEHCLWYFVRQGGAPRISIKDNSELIHLDDLYEQYMFSSATKQNIEIKGQAFELTHIKLKAGSAKQHSIAWCAAGRLVEEENLAGKVPGLYGKLHEGDEDFLYACYVTSTFLDQHVRPERFGFDISEISDHLFTNKELSLNEIREAVLGSVTQYLDEYLQESRKAGRERVERFASHKAPRYRPILGRIAEDKLDVDPSISDKDLDLLLHKQLTEIEGSLLAEGHEVMNFGIGESQSQYRARIATYLGKVDDLKKSDLANYVFHRKAILDILGKAIQKGSDGKYAREELIHELIMPMRKTSNEVLFDGCNLWLIDERLAFHDFLASDKPISTMPITSSESAKEPDLCALNVFDQPILVADGKNLPLASIVVVEIKRPMRNDAKPGEEKDPVAHALGYLERIRTGGAQTASGRPIPRSEQIPGFCYAICDLTPSIETQCKILGLRATSDNLGYFGYNPNYNAYIEVMSFDRLLNAARERNRAFFDKLGLPTQ